MDKLKRILLVEDDAKDIELTLNALSESSLANKIEVVRDGVEALDYLYRRGTYASRAKGNPVLILLDLKVPRVDGIQVLKQLKSDEQMRLIPIVILTSSRVEREMDECYKLGVNAYIVKPVLFAEFVEAVKRIGVFWALTNEPPPGSVRE